MAKKNNNKGLTKLSSKYVEYKDALDTPARLFRLLLDDMNMNPMMWAKLLREHLEHTVVMEDKDKEKKTRNHHAGNYRSAFFDSKKMSFNKLLEALSILQFKKCKITIEVTDMNDKVTVVSEECIIRNCKNSSQD